MNWKRCINFLAEISLKCTWVEGSSALLWSHVVRPSLTFHIFDFSSETTERNSTKHDRKQDLKALYQVCVFRADQMTKMAAPASNGLRFSTSSLKRLKGIWRNTTGSKISTSSTKFVFFGPIGKPRWRSDRWLAETFSTSPLKPLNEIQRNLIGSKTSTSSTQFVFFGPIGKRDYRPASDWLRHFRLLLWNCETEFDETWQNARSQRPLPSLCFQADRKTNMAAQLLIDRDTFTVTLAQQTKSCHLRIGI